MLFLVLRVSQLLDWGQSRCIGWANHYKPNTHWHLQKASPSSVYRLCGQVQMMCFYAYLSGKKLVAEHVMVWKLNLYMERCILLVYLYSLVPRSSHCPVCDCLQDTCTVLVSRPIPSIFPQCKWLKIGGLGMNYCSPIRLQTCNWTVHVVLQCPLTS